MNYGSVYLIVKDFKYSMDFYEKILGVTTSNVNADRFAVFQLNGFCLSLMNGFYDSRNPDKVIRKGEYVSEYDDVDKIAMADNPGKCVINLGTDDLRKEYARIQRLGVAIHMTTIRYINARNPYYYFTFKDPDDNIIEVTGGYEPEV